MGPNMEPKSLKNRSKNRSKFRWLFLSHFWSIFHPFWSQNGTKVRQKWTPKRVRTRKDLNSWNSIKTCSFSMILRFRAFSFKNKNIKKSFEKPTRCEHTVLHRLLVDFSSILPPFWEPNRTKNRSKKHSKKRTSKKRRQRSSRTPSGIDGGDSNPRF